MVGRLLVSSNSLQTPVYPGTPKEFGPSPALDQGSEALRWAKWIYPHPINRWVSGSLLAPLTIALLSYPVHLRPEFGPVQSLSAIPRIDVFVALFILWMSLLLIVAWSVDRTWHGAVLVVTFVAVFLGFWTAHLLHGSFEDWLRMADVANVRLLGSIPQGIQCYCWWPGTALWGVATSEIVGREIPEFRIITVLAGELTLSLLLYFLFLRLLTSARLAVLGTVIAVMGNVMLARFHLQPSYFVLIPLAAFLLIASRLLVQGEGAIADSVAMMLLGAGIAVTHFVTSILLFFLLAGFSFLHRWRRDATRSPLSPAILGLFILIPLAWQVYWPIRRFESLVGLIPQLFSLLANRDFGAILWYTRAVMEANISASPLWANVTRIGWLVALYLAAIPLAIGALTVKRPHPSLRWTGVGLLSVTALTSVAVVIGQGGEQYYRYITYGSFFAAPQLLLWLQSYGTRGIAFMLVAGILALVSVPTFLANNNLVSSAAHYYTEVSAARMLAESTQKGKALRLYENGSGSVSLYYQPGALVASSAAAESIMIRSEKDLRDSMLVYVDDFLGARTTTRNGEQPVFVLSRRFALQNEHWLGTPASNRVFKLVEVELGTANRVFDSGFLGYYR